MAIVHSMVARVGCILALGAGLGWAQAPEAKQEPKPGGGLTFTDEVDLFMLLNTPIVSASKTAEKLSEAPATVIVVSRDDIERRGYVELSEILDDLPGMEMIRPYGDTFMKNYWRGFRNTIGEPFLVMVDGVVMNHLYYNTADTPLASHPLSNVERVEVVYGPASSVYGSNAFMGVINVITSKDRPSNNNHARATLLGGQNQRRVMDANFFYKKDDFRLSVTYREDLGRVDPKTAENYELTKNHYYADRRTWGAFVDNANFGGSHNSQWRNRAIDLRAYMGNTEFGLISMVTNTGYGNVYAADRAQNNAVWARPEMSFHLRHSQAVSDWVTSTTLVRYRTSDVRRDSYFVYGYPDSKGRPLVDFSWWQTLNNSQSLYQDFDLRFNDAWSATLGLKYERKDLQKAYDAPYGPDMLASDITSLSKYPFPAVPADTPNYQNRIITEDRGAFVQAKWKFLPNQQLNVGLRSDSNSVYGAATTVRMGYVGNFGAWGFKGLFGQAYQEPTPRTLYGGWGGSGSDPDLKPEKSDTLELSGSYTEKSYALTVSLWSVKDKETIVTLKPGSDKGKGAKNLGERDVSGLDVHFQSGWNPGWAKQLKVWAYLSRYFKTDEQKFRYDTATSQFVSLGNGEIGDLAKTKVWLGATLVINENFDLTLRGRMIGARDTVETNPVRSVDSYSTLDLTANAHWKGLGVMVRVANLTNKDYFHPGVRAANAGITPGTFSVVNGENIYSGGAKGDYSSLLAQPGMNVQVGLKFSF